MVVEVVSTIMAHNPKCQHSSCHRTANDYDERFGKIVFFCNDTVESHNPRIMDENFRDEYDLEQLTVVCGGCENLFSVDAFEEERLDDFECPECEVEDKIMVSH